MSKALLVSGHTLMLEGAPHDINGVVLSAPYGIVRGGPGRGKCSCGELSLTMRSAAQRKQWHRKHKEQIVQAQQTLVKPPSERTPEERRIFSGVQGAYEVAMSRMCDDIARLAEAEVWSPGMTRLAIEHYGGGYALDYWDEWLKEGS